jgi:hypothetical protein
MESAEDDVVAYVVGVVKASTETSCDAAITTAHSTTIDSTENLDSLMSRVMVSVCVNNNNEMVAGRQCLSEQREVMIVMMLLLSLKWMPIFCSERKKMRSTSPRISNSGTKLLY